LKKKPGGFFGVRSNYTNPASNP